MRFQLIQNAKRFDERQREYAPLWREELQLMLHCYLSLKHSERIILSDISFVRRDQWSLSTLAGKQKFNSSFRDGSLAEINREMNAHFFFFFWRPLQVGWHLFGIVECRDR